MNREIDDVTGEIIDAAVKLHTRLGPGLLESVYEAVLARELERRGLHVLRQASVSFELDGMRFDEGLRVDLLVERRVVVELKSVENLAPVHYKQVLTYLRLLNLPVGLLINFGGSTLKEGLHRVVNNYVPSPSAPPREPGDPEGRTRRRGEREEGPLSDRGSFAVGRRDRGTLEAVLRLVDDLDEKAARALLDAASHLPRRWERTTRKNLPKNSSRLLKLGHPLG